VAINAARRTLSNLPAEMPRLWQHQMLRPFLNYDLWPSDGGGVNQDW
jgi:hypothetical protein